jgi:hypothetical protein
MPLKKLATKDELGNNAAHFFKSGNILRHPENDKLLNIKASMPETVLGDKPVQYDLWYNIKDSLTGFVYTDLFTNFIYLKPANEKYCLEILRQAIKHKEIEDALPILANLRDNNVDKYKLRPTSLNHDFVIFLPGSNILKKVVNLDKVANAVAQGAKLKLHPITSNPLVESLKYRFGRNAILDKKISGHTLLNRATRVGYCQNSELGMLAMIKEKGAYDFGLPNNWLTYSAIYQTLFCEDCKTMNCKEAFTKLAAIVACPYSGIIPYQYPTRVDYFFDFFKQGRHDAPTYFSGEMRFAS